MSYWDLLPHDIKRIILCQAFQRAGKPIWSDNIAKVHEQLLDRTFCILYSEDLNNTSDLFVSEDIMWHRRHTIS